jgi:integrase
VHADRARAAIGSTFKWAIKRRLANVVADPTAGLGKRASSTARTRVLCDDELARLWRATASDHAPITRPMSLIFRLAIVTGQRRTEVAGPITSELRLDGLVPNI